jgi:uncharacterized protein with PhoU and TrkA domain
MELRIQQGNWVAGKTLRDCALTREGVKVLGIQHDDDSYLGAPDGSTQLVNGDTLILYGRAEILTELSVR